MNDPATQIHEKLGNQHDDKLLMTIAMLSIMIIMLVMLHSTKEEGVGGELCCLGSGTEQTPKSPIKFEH